MSVVVTVHESTKMFGFCDSRCPLKADRYTCKKLWAKDDENGIYPGPLCPAYRLQAVKAAWFLIAKLTGR